MLALRGKRSVYSLVLLSFPIVVGLWSQIRLLILPNETTTLDARVAVFVFGTTNTSSAASGAGRFHNDQCKGLRATISDGYPETNDLRCLDDLAVSMARIWTAKPIHNWCPSSVPKQRAGSRNATTNTRRIAGEHSSPQEKQGIILIKVPKSASSTCAGMALHVSHRHLHRQHTDPAPSESANRTQQQQQQPPSCPVTWEHTVASTYANRDTTRTFLWAPIRWPVARAMSDVYFHRVSLGGAAVRRENDPADGFLISQLRRIPPNFIVRYTTLQPFKDPTEYHRQNNNHSTMGFAATAFGALHHHVQQILHEYDFLLVVDRLLESVVVLAHLTNTSWMDWMTLSSKTSGSWHRPGRSQSNRCTRLISPPPLKSKPRIQAYIEEEWMARHVGDLLLYRAANASLDRTIDAIGREWVDHQLQHAQAFQSHIQRMCANETYFPCSNEGVVQLEQSQQSCYARDFGCGHACVRRIAAGWEAGSRPVP